MKILILGLGNPILGDDGVGWRVAQELQHTATDDERYEIDCISLGGLGLMERLIGYDRAILVDAIQTGTQPIGHIAVLGLDELGDPGWGHLSAAHDTTLQTALRLGRDLGAHLPEQITLVGVETQADWELSEQLSQAVQAAVPRAVEVVLNQLAA